MIECRCDARGCGKERGRQRGKQVWRFVHALDGCSAPATFPAKEARRVVPARSLFFAAAGDPWLRLISQLCGDRRSDPYRLAFALVRHRFGDGSGRGSDFQGGWTGF